MPRKRQIDPAFYSDEVMVSLPLEACWLYQALWCWADDGGNVEDSPGQWRLWAFTGRDYPKEAVIGWREDLIRANRLIPYSVNGKLFCHIPTLLNHQNIQHPSKPRCPTPPPDIILTEDSMSTQEKDGELTDHSKIGTRVEESRVELNRSTTPPTPPREVVYPESWNEYARKGANILLSLPQINKFAQASPTWFISGWERQVAKCSHMDAEAVLRSLEGFREWWDGKELQRPFSAVHNWLFKARAAR